MAFKARFQIKRERLEFAYSLLIIVLIPIGLIINTVWFANALKRDFDTELRRKANLAGQITAVQVASILATTNAASRAAATQQAVDRIKARTDEIKALTVLVPENTSFRVIASTAADQRDKTTTDLQMNLAWTQDSPIAAPIEAGDGSGRVWRVIGPVKDAQEQKIGLVSLDVSLAAADALTTKTLRTSMIILVITVIITLLLLANHFRFVEYAVLFRKQKELDQMKNDFISVATHELKAPMAIIKGYLANVLDGSSGKVDPTAAADIKVAFDQTDRLAHLVADLLDVSRLEQGHTKYELQPVNLTDIIQPIITTYRPRAAERGIDVSYVPPTEPAVVITDPNRAGEIFTNLIDNAVKYSQKGQVEISHQREGSTIRTMVKDAGIGMSPAERSRLFQRFYRARNDKTENISGTGLGLWIIKQYIEAMGGKITVDSQEGLGTTFTVTLPQSKTKA